MKYFTIDEFKRTGTGLPNIPTPNVIKNIEELVKNILDPAREKLGEKIIVTSGYRDIVVNSRVGGAVSSQHTTGNAADIKCINNSLLFDIIKKQGNFDQLIWEFGNDKKPDWIHVSYTSIGNRKEVLRSKKVNGKVTYEKIS